MSLHHSTQSPSRSAIIYQNTALNTILIDIPTSIAAAQGRSDTLLSTTPLDTPLALKDEYVPKSQKAMAKRNKDPVNEALHAEYKSLIDRALTEIRNHVSGPWCAPRTLLTQEPTHGDDETMELDSPEKDLESRLKEWAAWDSRKGDGIAFDVQMMMASLGATSESGSTVASAVTQKWFMSFGAARESENGAHVTSQKNQNEPWPSTFCNTGDHSLKLLIYQNASQHVPLGLEYRFTVPPRSTLFLSDSTHSDMFRRSFRELTDDHNLPRHFDLVLLDPPWPNRSAKRKGAYEQVGGMPFLKKMLLKMDIDTYLEHNSLVGVWITNKASLRDHVLGPGGLFEAWNVGLVEEWIWIKTTTQGEPMFDIDNLNRKPYEILLLGRAAPNSWTTMAHAETVERRVIAAVPDIHSRKPCLKDLFELCMRDAQDYSALEVFSRYLVSGWTSWGNEVMKYNEDRYWAS